MSSPLYRARALHVALVVACVGLIVLSLASDSASRYATARDRLAALQSIDLDNWARNVENRQHVVLGVSWEVEDVLLQEAGRARLPVSTGLRVREQMSLQVHPSVADTSTASLETLLTQLFANVDRPRLFHPDADALRASLRELFSQQAAQPGGRLELSEAVLDFDSSRDPTRRALLRLAWSAGDASAPAFTRDLPLAGSDRDELEDFDQFVRKMVPELDDGQAPWPQRVRQQLAPVWDEIKDLTLGTASLHVRERLDATRGSLALFGVTLHRQQMLVFGSMVLLALSCALALGVRRLDPATVREFPLQAALAGPLDPAWSLMSTLLLPFVAGALMLVHLGDARLTGTTVVSGLALCAGALCALQSGWQILRLRRPPPSESEQQRIARTRASVAAFGRSAMRPSRVLGRVLLAVGLVAGPVGAVGFSFYLIGLGIGAQTNGALPFLALMLSPPLVVAGWLLAAGRKDLVLFLRRFGNEALNDAVRDLVQTVLRQRARLVTLDDSVFVPLGPRWRGLAASLMPSAIVLGGIALSYAGFAKVARSELEDETPFGAALALIQLGIVFVGVVAGVVVVWLFVAAVRAHIVGRMAVSDDASLARALRRLRKLRSWARAPSIAAPMATVVSVSDAEWQTAVASMVRLCDVTLTDISQPSESIRWELATLRDAQVRVILLAQRDALARWWARGGDDADGRLAAAFRTLADGLPLVIYDAPDRLAETELLAMLSGPASPIT